MKSLTELFSLSGQHQTSQLQNFIHSARNHPGDFQNIICHCISTAHFLPDAAFVNDKELSLGTKRELQFSGTNVIHLAQRAGAVHGWNPRARTSLQQE